MALPKTLFMKNKCILSSGLTFSSSKCQSFKLMFGIFCILTFIWLGVVIYDGNLDEKSLSMWWELQHCKSMIPNKIYKERQIFNV